ncbi:MAG TPA: hypothetical protein ENI97_07255 [Gammaproteobacteria bacterium]|nr:hypothetical protein [Gammaproteobacteria bacterium]
MTDKTAGRDETGDLRADIDALRADLAELADSFTAFLQAQQKNAGAKVEGDAEAEAATAPAPEDESQWQEFRRKLEETRQHSEQTLEDINAEVAEHPLASLAVAFGVGYLAGKLLK